MVRTDRRLHVVAAVLLLLASWSTYRLVPQLLDGDASRSGITLVGLVVIALTWAWIGYYSWHLWRQRRSVPRS
jgi:hypothetical protein